MAKNKVVTVVIEKRIKYSVEGGASDDAAKEIVKARMESGMPLGMLGEPEEEIKAYEVKEEG